MKGYHIAKYCCNDCEFFLESLLADNISNEDLLSHSVHEMDRIVKHLSITGHATGTMFVDGRRISTRNHITDEVVNYE